jgi:hypothetical protein
MKNYKASVFLKRPDHYTKPMPHPKWWRRWLGQTVSYEIGFERVVYEFQAPQAAISADWFQEMIRKSLMQVSENSNVLLYDGSMMFEENRQATQYIPTEGGIVEPSTTNHLLNNTEEKK